jgi:hypothetical protein
MTIDSINLEGTRLASADSTVFAGAGAGLAVHPLFRPTDAQCQLLTTPRANTAPDGQHKRISIAFIPPRGKENVTRVTNIEKSGGRLARSLLVASSDVQQKRQSRDIDERWSCVRSRRVNG